MPKYGAGLSRSTVAWISCKSSDGVERVRLVDFGTDMAVTAGLLSALGLRRFTLLELSGMELHEVAHGRRRFAGELFQGVR